MKIHITTYEKLHQFYFWQCRFTLSDFYFASRMLAFKDHRKYCTVCTSKKKDRKVVLYL